METTCGHPSGIDPESGERTINISVNEETGEVEGSPKLRKGRPFKIPERCIDSKKIKIIRTRCEPPLNIPNTSERRRQQFLTALLFLIPSVLFFNLGKTFGLVFLNFEMWLHQWCHYKNKQLHPEARSKMYYQSPLHLISREFCRECFNDRTKYNIKQLQNNRYLRHYGLQSLRRIVT